MKTVRRLDKTGDTAIAFDANTAEQEAAAKKMFDDWMAKKLPAFMTKRVGGAEDQKITSFDQIEEGSEVILVPAIVAG